jgi:hypothetical protein
MIPVAMTILFLAGFSLGDDMPLLNPYELVRHSGAAFLPESGTHFIADAHKLYPYALAVGWVAWISVSALGSFIFLRILKMIR